MSVQRVGKLHTEYEEILVVTGELGISRCQQYCSKVNVRGPYILLTQAKDEETITM